MTMADVKKHIPMRMCAICRTRAPKAALKRFTHVSEGADPVPDQKQIAPGRGVYVCNEQRCQEAFSRRRVKRKAKGQEV